MTSSHKEVKLKIKRWNSNNRALSVILLIRKNKLGLGFQFGLMQHPGPKFLQHLVTFVLSTVGNRKPMESCKGFIAGEPRKVHKYEWGPFE